jgi:3-oxoacyl-[acyl-carrier protein] reductase
MQLLKWTTAFVTGGSRGIGRGIVLKLAESGVKRIALNYLSNDDAANDTVKKTKDRGAEVILIKRRCR